MNRKTPLTKDIINYELVIFEMFERAVFCIKNSLIQEGMKEINKIAELLMNGYEVHSFHPSGHYVLLQKRITVIVNE